MQVDFLGAAQTVTGSMHLVRTRHAAVLLDCGLYQGRRRESYERNRELELPVGELSAVVLSHAHIDHSGALPILAKHGYQGPIWATPATRDLSAIMLRDAANIMASDARTLTRQNARENRDLEVYPPLYDDDDVVEAVARFQTVPYHRSVEIARGVRLAFLDAGHVLGSAITVLDVEEGGARRRIVFTGDLGRVGRPILRDPEVPEGAEVLISESTYGDRLHDGVEKMEEDLAAVVERTLRRGGKLLIPSFALERAQEVVFALKHLRARGQLPPVPVYIDSPLTIRITDAFKLHPECFDAETRALFRGVDSPFEFPELRYVESVEDSKAVTASAGPAIVISASGMCEGGRILHHLQAAVGSPDNTVLIVGFQAQHTLGRRLVERRDRVRIFGLERERRCEVVVLNGFSAHADQRDLLDYADRCRERGRLERIALVHGDPAPQKVLAGLLRDRGHARIATPAMGESLDLLYP
jgi:metallo-beta-lactamase family protein